MAMTSPRHEPIIVREEDGVDPSHVFIPEHYREDVSRVMLPAGYISDRIKQLASDIYHAHPGETLHFLCVLKGAYAFFTQLLEQIAQIHQLRHGAHVPFSFDFIRVKSYEGTESSGEVRVEGDISPCAGRHVVVVEDIVDTGLTMDKLLPMIHTAGATSVEVATLLEKRTERSNGFKARFVGFSVPDHFLVGFGLDFNEAYRDLGHICIISERGIQRYKDGIPSSS